MLGDEVEIRFIEGVEKLRIPPGTQHNEVIRIPGRGVHNGKEKGDFLVQINLKVPDLLSAKQRALYEKLRELRQE